MSFPILTTLVALPIAGALLLLLVGRDEQQAPLARRIALVVSILVFAETLLLWSRFNGASADFQFVERYEWIPAFGISYFVGVDGISLLLVVLTGFLTPIALLGSWESVHKRVRAFSIVILLLESAMIGVFVSLDLFLFYVFWDAMLIPMYFLIGIWGYERRIYAAVKFLLYTMAGSVLMLLAILGLAYLHSQATGQYSFDLLKLYELPIAANLQVWFFLAFALAFAIKVPLFPFHTWLPDAHVEAPTAGSVILAGVLLKLGTYGFYRFNIPMFPAASADESYFGSFGVRSVMIFLAIVGIIYGALAAMYFVVKKDGDVKKLVAYSSVSSMGIVMLGLFALNPNGINGAVLHMINHGIYSAALFLLVGIIYERRHTRNVAEFGGLSHVMPGYAAVFLAMVMTAIGLPLLCVFISEFLSLRGAFEANPIWSAWGALGIILNAAYMLWLYQRMFFGNIENPKNEKLSDLSIREWAYMMPLVVMSLVLGVYPGPFLRYIEKPVNAT